MSKKLIVSIIAVLISGVFFTSCSNVGSETNLETSASIIEEINNKEIPKDNIELISNSDYKIAVADLLFNTLDPKSAGYSLLDIDECGVSEILISEIGLDCSKFSIYKYNDDNKFECILQSLTNNYCDKFYYDKEFDRLFTMNSKDKDFKISIYSVDLNKEELTFLREISSSVGIDRESIYSPKSIYIDGEQVDQEKYIRTYNEFLGEKNISNICTSYFGLTNPLNILNVDSLGIHDNNTSTNKTKSIEHFNYYTDNWFKSDFNTTISNTSDYKSSGTDKFYTTNYSWDEDKWIAGRSLRGNYDSRYLYKPRSDKANFKSFNGVISSNGSIVYCRKRPGIPIHGDYDNKINGMLDGTKVFVNAKESTNTWYKVSGIAFNGDKIDCYVLGSYVKFDNNTN